MITEWKHSLKFINRQKKAANPFVVPKTVNTGLTVEQLRKLLQYNSLYALFDNDRL